MQCRLVKRIPEAPRLAAAEKLTLLLSVIIKNPYNLQAWIDLMLFLSCCLKVPGCRSGRKHQKAPAGKLNEVIQAYPGKSVATVGLRCTNRVAAAHKSYNKRTEQERMAARVSEMLEDAKTAMRGVPCGWLPSMRKWLLTAITLRHSYQQTSSRCIPATTYSE
jgi:hypothetical protein